MKTYRKIVNSAVIIGLAVIATLLINKAPEVFAEAGVGYSSMSGTGSTIDCTSLTDFRKCPVYTTLTIDQFRNAWNGSPDAQKYDPAAKDICIDSSINTDGWVIASIFPGSGFLMNPVMYTMMSGGVTYRYDPPSAPKNGTWPAKYRNGLDEWSSYPGGGSWYNKLLEVNPGLINDPINGLFKNEVTSNGYRVSLPLAFYCPGMVRITENVKLGAQSRINDMSTQNYLAVPGEWVTFSHWVNRDNTNSPGDGIMQVVQPEGSSLRPGDGDQRALNGGSFTVDGYNTPRINIPFQIPANAANGQRFCQQIRFWAPQDGNGHINSSSWGYSNMVCVKVATPIYCPTTNTTATIRDGYSVGRSVARKNNAGDWLSSKTDPLDTNNPGKGIIWATPRDKVQFQHTLCPGAQLPLKAAQSTGGSGVGANWNQLSIGATNMTFFGASLTTGAASVDRSSSSGIISETAPERTFLDPDNTSRTSLTANHVGKRLTETMYWSICRSTAAVDGQARYNITGVDGTQYSTAASVYVPYNYKLIPKLVVPSNPVIHPGETINPTGELDITPRQNTEVQNNEYATRTRPSGYEIVTFTVVPRNGSAPKPTGYENPNNVVETTPVGYSRGASCGYYTGSITSYLYNGCRVERDGFGERYNVDSILGQSTAYLQGIGGIAIDDLPVGSKYCIALSVWPADSHNNMNATRSTGADGDPSLTESSVGLWAHTPPTCYDVAKKPHLQVWGGSVFSNGAVTTSVSDKLIDGTRRRFGSWGEYAAIGLKSIKGFGSGAAYGYNWNNGGQYLAALPGGLTNLSTCVASRSTITNNNCNGSPERLGYLSIGSDTIATNTINRIVSRYASPNGKPIDVATVDLGTLEDGKYIVKNSNVRLYGAIGKGKTISILVNGTATIAGNITYPNGPYNSINELSQLLIFADQINIEPQVRTIDAWLVAGQTGRGSGTIHTCYNYNVGDDDVSKQLNADLNQCGYSLIVNGPVIANKLITNRTAGSGVRYASIDPGEIFNLRPDVFLWANAQARQTTQAHVTHTRSLPPRF